MMMCDPLKVQRYGVGIIASPPPPLSRKLFSDAPVALPVMENWIDRSLLLFVMEREEDGIDANRGEMGWCEGVQLDT